VKTNTIPIGRETHYLSGLSDYSTTNTGDICQFLGSTNATLRGYRMPMSSEFGSSENDWNNWTTISSSSTDVAYGKKIIAEYRAFKANSVAFPASGYRYNAGKLELVGSYGIYWSGSAHSNNEASAYGLFFNSDDVDPSGYGLRTGGLAVRCVKN
ncbi:MAG: hypothetical protein LBB64_03210, partial [Dysgonamonadaceae bacterium]|jgi:uncharacterized protein (TIGR02145 family)|nr:hypothetical protein [Dysgonamonadaceae bacterium]